MRSPLFSGVALCGSGALALWVAMAFPLLAPRTARGVALRLLLAVASLGAMTPAFGAARVLMNGPMALMLVTLPSGVVLLLALRWLLLWVACGAQAPSR